MTDRARRPTPLSLGAYDLLEPLAKGAMGEIWRGRHRALGVPVAVKCLLQTDAEDDWAETAFANEVRAAAGLSHPAIVVVLDHGVVDSDTSEASSGRLAAGSPYLVMELLGGDALHDHVGRMDWPDLQRVLAQLLDALSHSHARGVIHRDLKPGNILVDPRTDALGRPDGWHVRLTDFGLAQAIDRHSASDRVVAGTPAYMAPELLQGDWRDQGPWTDLYSLGCLGWALASGQPPFGRQREFAEFCLDHLHRPPPALVPARPMPEAFEGWLRRLLAKDRRDRYASAADAQHALAGLPEEPRLLPPEEPPAPAPTDGPVIVGDVAPGTFDDETTGSPIRQAAPPPVPEVSTKVLPDELPPAPEVPFPAPPGRDPLPLSRATVTADWRSADADAPAHKLLGVGLNLYGLRTIPVVDRAQERDRIWEGLVRVEQTGRAHSIVLRGPSGSGKTRLAEWVGQLAHASGGATVLRARHSVADGPGTGLAAMLARHLRCANLPRAQVLGRIERMAARHGLVEPDEVVALTELLCPATDDEVTAGAPMVRFDHPRERFTLLARVLEHLDPLSRPLVLLADDVQWGADAMAFTEWLLERQVQRPVPIFVVLTAQEAALVERPDEAIALERLGQRDDGRVVEIGPLSPDAHAQLVRTLLGMDGELVARVTRRTAGNPLFAVQLIGDWVSRGVLEPGGKGFRLKPGVPLHLPDDLRAVWRSRVDRLLDGYGEPETKALELAATLGDKVSDGDWRAVCARTGVRADVRHLLGRLLVLRLARVDPDGDGWHFTHPMLRESLLWRARDADRQTDWHRACASVLEVRHAQKTGVSERIAWHLLEAGDDRDALGYLLRAARERLAGGDGSAAERLLDERQAAIRRLGLPPEDPLHATGWFLRLRVLRIQGRAQEAVERVDLAISEARINGWRDVLARARVHQGVLLHRTGAFPWAWRRLRQAEEMARQDDDHGLISLALLEQGRALIEHGRLGRAVPILEESRARAAMAGQERPQASCGWLLGRVAKQQGDLDKAMTRFEDALALFERVGARFGVASCTNELGEVARLRGDLDAAEARYRDALARMDELGADDAHVVRLNLAQVLLQRGRGGEAAPLLHKSLAAFTASGHRAMVGIVHAFLLSCVAQAADWEGWDHHSAAAIEALTETGWVEHDVAAAAQRAGDLAAAAGETERARHAWRMARLQWERLERPDDVAAAQARIDA